MNFLNNLKIKSKLILLVTLPVLGLLYFSTVQLTTEYSNLNNLKKIEKVAILSSKISHLVHETQKERGMTAGYLGSKGKKFGDKLPKQRELANEKFKDMSSYIATLDFTKYEPELKDALDKAMNLFQGLSQIRPSVTSQSISAKKAISYYTKMNATLLDDIVSIAKLTKDIEISHQLTAYSSFLLSKERAGIERAVGSNTLSKDAFGPGMKTKLNNLIGAQNTYMDSFKAYATKDAITYYKKTLKGESVDNVNKIRFTLLNSEVKHNIMSDIKKYVGYGGLIHNFKNYVIRGDQKYAAKVNKQYKEVVSLISKYKALPNVTSEELKLVNDISSVFTKYHKGLPSVVSATKNNMNVKQLDKVVKVSDSPAINAIDKLSTSVFSVDSVYWFTEMTKKINLLKNIDDHLSTVLIRTVQDRISVNQTNFYIHLVLILVIMFVVYLLLELLH